jgi:hypothetical protein
MLISSRAMQRIWFAAWNADNQRARDEYERTLAEMENPQADELEEIRPVGKMCRNRKHWKTAASTRPDGRCLPCYEDKKRRWHRSRMERKRREEAA